MVTYPSGTGQRPWSIVVGDLNNDNKMDIIFTSPGTNNVGVFFGDDNGTFASKKIYPTGSNSYPKHVAVGDLNGDSLLDIIVANYGENNVGVFLGQSNGTFAVQKTFSTVPSRPKCVAVGNFNNDDHLDIVIVHEDTSSIGVMLGYGDSTFGALRTYSTGFDSDPNSVAIGDFNNDKLLDIVVANTGTNNIGIFLAYENGTFASQITYSTSKGSKPISVTCGDINNDNLTDIIVANSGTRTIGLILGGGNETSANQTIVSTGGSSDPYTIAVGDFNNDHNLDMAVGNSGSDQVSVFLGYGTSTFASQKLYSTGFQSFPDSIAIGDFDNNRKLDIIVANPGKHNIGIFFGYGNGSFRDQVIHSTGPSSSPSSVVIADFNNDNQTDIVVANSGTSTIGIFLGHGDGTFENQTTYSTGNLSSPESIAVGDFNNDHQLDIVVVNGNIPTFVIFFGNNNGTFTNQKTYSIGNSSQPRSIAVGDFNHDNLLDVAIVNTYASNVGIFLGCEDGTFANPTIFRRH
ncbi:unnamed protein product [Rotaria sordida]|uniref:Uncharacterized protein n=1 Tax=Rotaria sordida TaxID=392033 RepID=A0A814BM41_9BILA|nr:unnamed protein product [Rotaria sordida]